MLAPNGKIYPLSKNALLSHERIRYMFDECSEQLEWSASLQKLVCFSFSETDLEVLHQLYGKYGKNEALLFEIMIGDLLRYFEFRHRIFQTFQVAGTRRFYCRFQLHIPVQDKNSGEVS